MFFVFVCVTIFDLCLWTSGNRGVIRSWGLALYKPIHVPAKHRLFASTTTSLYLLEYVVCPFHVGVCVLATDPFSQQNPDNKTPRTRIISSSRSSRYIDGEKEEKEVNPFNSTKLHAPSLNQHEVSNIPVTRDFSLSLSHTLI